MTSEKEGEVEGWDIFIPLVLAIINGLVLVAFLYFM